MNKVLILLVILLSACSPPKPSWVYDQCMRAELFQQCLATLPAGPLATKYNDWNEVVQECGDQARHMSVRSREDVKKECRSD